MSLKTNMLPLEEKIRLVERVAQNLRIGGRAGNMIAAENYEGLKAVLVDLQAQLPIARHDTVVEVERALDGVLRSKTALGYSEGSMINLATTIMRRWPTIRPALEKFEKVAAIKPAAKGQSGRRGR